MSNKRKETVVIGICGGSGSGKTTVANQVKKCFSNSVTLVSYDNYYKTTDDLSAEERKKLNYDAPEAFDTERALSDLRRLIKKETVLGPKYDFEAHNRSKETIRLESSDVVIVEGILVFQNEELRELMDIKVFIDTDSDERLIRRLLRDGKDRGRSMESVLEQYIKTVRPMHLKYVEPFKSCADIIVSGNADTSAATEEIFKRARALLEG